MLAVSVRVNYLLGMRTLILESPQLLLKLLVRVLDWCSHSGSGTSASPNEYIHCHSFGLKINVCTSVHSSRNYSAVGTLVILTRVIERKQMHHQNNLCRLCNEFTCKQQQLLQNLTSKPLMQCFLTFIFRFILYERRY